MRVLVVEDEPKTARHLDRGLREAGFEVQACTSAEQGLSACAKQTFDALVLDVMLPGMSGLEMVHQLRSSGVTTPVLFLSAKDATEDRIKGLNEGGDDYLVKPYSLPEVVARLRALLRRGGPPGNTKRVQVADLVWEPTSRRISRMGKRVDLTPKEYALATLLLNHQGEVVSRNQIIQAVWGLSTTVDGNSVDVQVLRLRKKLDDPFETKLIRTLRGVGIVLEAPDA